MGFDGLNAEVFVVIFFFCVCLLFALNCVITAVIPTREAGIAQAVPVHWVTKNRGSITGRSKRLFSPLKRPARLFGPVSILFNGHRVPFLPLVKAAGA